MGDSSQKGHAGAAEAAGAAYARGEAHERELRLGAAAAAFAEAAALATSAAEGVGGGKGAEGRERLRELERLAVRARCRQAKQLSDMSWNAYARSIGEIFCERARPAPLAEFEPEGRANAQEALDLAEHARNDAEALRERHNSGGHSKAAGAQSGLMGILSVAGYARGHRGGSEEASAVSAADATLAEAEVALAAVLGRQATYADNVLDKVSHEPDGAVA